MRFLGLALLLGGLILTACGGNDGPSYDPYTDYDTTTAFLTGTFVNKSFPSDWTYIPDSVDYPDPSWCKSEEPHELKLKLLGMGVSSPSFVAHDDIKVAICVESIGKINETISEEGSEHIFQVRAYDEENAVLETLYADDVEAYHVSEVTFTADYITKIDVTMIGYYRLDDMKKALGVCKIACFGNASSVVPPEPATTLSVTYDNLGGATLPSDWDDTMTAETSNIGTYTVNEAEFKVNFKGKWRISTNNKELGSKNDPASYLLSVSEVNVSKMTIDYYSTVCCEVYNSIDSSTTAISGVSEEASANESSVVKSYAINSAAWSLKMTASKCWIYSITFSF